MKISTAIRKGSKGMKQLRRKMFIGPFYKPTGCCALGAARLGVGALPIMGHYLRQLLPRITELVETEDGDESIRSLIMYQNDDLGWSFREIADWLEYYGY